MSRANLRREMMAEFLGTFVLMTFGLGVNAQVFLGGNDLGGFQTINFGWGFAVMLAVYVAGGVTGAHINPAVSLAMAVRGDLAWQRLGPYVLAQMLGAFVASALIFLVYYEALEASWVASGGRYSFESAGIWATYPRQFSSGERLTSLPGGFVDQIVATALLLICVCAAGDPRNLAPQSNLAPLVVGSAVLMIGMSFGFNCGFAINPARDLGPRLFTAVAGWGSEVFTRPDRLWWLVPVMGPLIGGVLGVLCYDALIRRLHPPEEAK